MLAERIDLPEELIAGWQKLWQEYGEQPASKERLGKRVPARGRIADMGSTLGHSEKIIALYMDGYTETEIKHRTGHS